MKTGLFWFLEVLSYQHLKHILRRASQRAGNLHIAFGRSDRSFRKEKEVEYFTEKNGKYYSRKSSGGNRRSAYVRIPLTVVPVFVMLGIYVISLKNGAGQEDLFPIIIGISFFLIIALLSFFLRKMGFGAGIIVDQMQGRLSFKLPTGQRHTIPIDKIKEIGLQHSRNSVSADRSTPGNSKIFTLLFLLTRDDKKHPVMYGRNAMEIRQFADELSILVSATVREYTGEKFSR